MCTPREHDVPRRGPSEFVSRAASAGRGPVAGDLPIIVPCDSVSPLVKVKDLKTPSWQQDF